MTIIILTIIAILAVAFGLFIYFIVRETPTYDELIECRVESVMFILVGIFCLLLALLFKFNPFW